MRIIVLSLALLFAAETPLSTVAKLASYLSEGDAPDALGVFDSHVRQYGEIEQNIEAITAQTDVTCAIDIVDDVETDGVHKLDLDWILNLKSKLDNSVEPRRERVQVEMRQIKGKWKITALSPIAILDPIHIK